MVETSKQLVLPKNQIMFDRTKQNVLGNTSRLVENTTIKGNIQSKSDIRLDCFVEGNINCEGKIIIGQKGEIKGDVKCKNLDIEGKFIGNLDVAELLLVKATAKIKGEVSVGKLSVEPGAIFEATCIMKSSLKAVSNEQSEKTA